MKIENGSLLLALRRLLVILTVQFQGSSGNKIPIEVS